MGDVRRSAEGGDGSIADVTLEPHTHPQRSFRGLFAQPVAAAAQRWAASFARPLHAPPLPLCTQNKVLRASYQALALLNRRRVPPPPLRPRNFSLVNLLSAPPHRRLSDTPRSLRVPTRAMADPPLGLTYVAPALDLPSWLSYTSTPTATTLEAYTVATLAPNGAPTLVTGAVEVTRYETILLQLAITVDSAADVRGQDLGTLYTTAGGTAAETVVNEVGGTRRFTLGASESTAGAGSRTAFEPTRTPAASQGAASASRSANPVSTGTSGSFTPGGFKPARSLTLLARRRRSCRFSQSHRLLAPAPSVSPGPAAASTASREQASLSSALASAAGASSAEAQALSSLSSDLASASSGAATIRSVWLSPSQT